MRPVDFLEPLTIHESGEPLRRALPTLRAGIAAAIPDRDGWRLLRPRDALAFPVSRQLCDLPSVELPTLGFDDEIDLRKLLEHDVWGATRGGELVGRIESLRVVSSVPPGAIYVEEHDNGREAILREMLHDLANALTVASAINEAPAPHRLDRSALSESLRHAVALVSQLRWLSVDEVGLRGRALGVRELVEKLEPVLRVAARPASLRLAGLDDVGLRAERWRLESVLLNLVLNASSHAESVIRLKMRAIPSGAEIAVEDNGPGFIRRADGASPQLRGYGMRSVRRQAAILGADIEIDRSPDLGGARVRIRLRPAP